MFFIAAYLAALFSLGIASGVQAAKPVTYHRVVVQPQSTALKLTAVPPIELAGQITFTATLTTGTNQPLAGKMVAFLIGGLYQGQAKTNGQGVATLTVSQDLSAGSYSVNAVFSGTRDYATSQASTGLVINPAFVEVQTVPATPGVQFQLGDQSFTSGADGIAWVSVSQPGTYQLQVMPGGGLNPNMRVSFLRWIDDVVEPYRQIKVPTTGPIQVGLLLTYRFGETFVDLQGNPVSPSRVTSLKLKNSQGTNYTFADGQPQWLPAVQVARWANGLEPVNIQYSVMSVVVDGSNVVTGMQQRYYPQPGQTLKISLLLFSAQIKAHDALLNTPVGDGIILEYPNGTAMNYNFGENEAVTINSLARGIYYVQVTGIEGIIPRTPIALSQNQILDITILTRLDIFLGVFIAAMVALSLLFLGRPLAFARRKKFAGASAAIIEQAPEWGNGQERD